MSQHGPSTRSVHLHRTPDPESRAITTPIVQSSAFAFPDLETWRRVALHEEAGDVYSRNSNPTARQFGERVAALEGGDAATTFATGMAAIFTTLLALLAPGRRAVTVRDAYGATYLAFTRLLPSYGIDTRVVDTADEAGLRRAIADGCDLLYLETPTNPRLAVLDLAALAVAAHEHGACVVVDNTFATPINQRPLELGADLVIHSGTKYLCGHGDALAGVLCGRRDLVEQVAGLRELTGPALDAHAAALMLRSLKTLGLRIARHNDNAMTVARHLQGHPRVAEVLYPGLEEHPGHAIAKRQMSGYGGVLSFVLRDGMEGAARLLPRLKLARLAANLGQVETTVGPASLTSHIELTEEERRASGVRGDTIRYAAGIEDPADLCADLDQALEGL